MTSPLFKTQRPKLATGKTTSIPATRVNTTNEAGGSAYSMSHEHAIPVILMGILSLIALKSFLINVAMILLCVWL